MQGVCDLFSEQLFKFQSVFYTKLIYGYVSHILLCFTEEGKSMGFFFYIKLWRSNDDSIFVFGWSAPLRLAKIIINVQGQVFNQNLGRLMFIWSTLREHACHDSFLKSLKRFEEKSRVYENDFPLSTFASFPKQPPWKLCSLFELEINSSIKATHTHKHTSPDSCSNIHFSQITFMASFI